jgi:hypothetical protein
MKNENHFYHIFDIQLEINIHDIYLHRSYTSKFDISQKLPLHEQLIGVRNKEFWQYKTLKSFLKHDPMQTIF